MLEIRLLGELEVVRDGSAVPLPASRKSRALLAFLAATARPHLRARLCELLWDGPDDPRAALRWSLTKIRPILDDDGVARIAADHEQVSFEPAGALVDLASLRAETGTDAGSLSIEALTRAAARFR